jgi:molybdate transport system substrate-binding protein
MIERTRSTMKTLAGSPMTRSVAVVVAALLVAANAARQDVRVVTSGAFTAAVIELLPTFEQRTAIKVETAFGASMGNTPDAIPNRLARGEPIDLVILAGPALDDLIKRGMIVPGSKVDLVRSNIGMVVRAGADKPNIDTAEGLTRVLLAAKSIAYSDSASGVYVSGEMFQRLGVVDRVAGKARKIEGERVAAVVARGDAEVGFQQISELINVPGAEYVGPLPDAVQRVTVFSAGIATGATHPDAARTLIKFLTSPEAAPAIRRTGLEPLTRN